MASKKNGSIPGTIQLGDDVVATIAGLAARDIPGIHALGKSRLISFGDSPTHGIEAEVGQTEAALDVDVIIEYGADIHEVADELKARIADEVGKMADRKVIEVNIHVVDVQLPEPEQPKQEERRVH